MQVAVSEPTLATHLEVEVLQTTPSGMPEDMKLGEVVVNARPKVPSTRFVEAVEESVHPAKYTTVTSDGSTETGERPVVVRRAVVKEEVEMVAPPPWKTTLMIPIEPHQAVEAGVYEVKLENYDVTILQYKAGTIIVAGEAPCPKDVHQTVKRTRATLKKVKG